MQILSVKIDKSRCENRRCWMNSHIWRKRWVERENAYRVVCGCGTFIGYQREQRKRKRV